MSEQIRHAASVVAVREGSDGAEVLVVERGASSRFLASYVVFPGGAVDGEDAAFARCWFADDGEAARAAAVRELVEEAGVAVTAAGLVNADGDDPLARIHAAPPRLDQLHELCHWVAPEQVPVRFDARYFAVRAPHRSGSRARRVEAVAAWWVAPQALLDEWEHGERRPVLAHLVHDDPAGRVRPRRRAVGRSGSRRVSPTMTELERLPRSVFWED